MSFIIGDEIVTEEIPVEVEPILNKLRENTRQKSMELMNTIAFSDKYISYVIPEAGMVIFVDELKDDRKLLRYLVRPNGELYIDNKQRKGEMFCPLFEKLEHEIKDVAGKDSDTVSDDKEYRVYDKFMPKIVDTINHIMQDKPEIFS